VAQLLRIAHDVDGDDAAVAMLECHGVDGAVFLAHDETGETVHGGRSHLRILQVRALARDTGDETQNLVRATDRIESRGTFAAAILIEHGVVGQKLG